MLDSYRIGYSGAVRRIGTPHEHDVLSGRGGAINSHVGNQHFREWVRTRKDRYNLARTKAEKARVANEVMDLVRIQNPPGRFLQRDTSSSMTSTTWWVEVDEIKAMAKTSQALREGAPSIRAAHKDDLPEGKKRTRKSSSKNKASSKQNHQAMQQQQPLQVTHSNTNVNTPMPPLEMSKSQAIRQLKANVEAAVYNTEAAAPALVAPPLMSNDAFENAYGRRRIKRSRLSENLYLPQAQPHIVADLETPPLEPMPSPVPLSDIPELGPSFPMPAIPKRESFRRTNSLALSDIGSGGGDKNWDTLEFVNPFLGDSDELSTPPLAPPMMSPFDQHHQPRNGSSGGNNGVRSRNITSNMSVKSWASDLSDLLDCSAISSVDQADNDFGEGMKAVYDAVHPGLTSPGKDEPIPTHLYPYRGGSFDLRQSSDSLTSPQLVMF